MFQWRSRFWPWPAAHSRPTRPTAAPALSRQIADDAASFNDAYGQAITAQILLNVLRSRDRLPRYYLAMTGISDSPSVSLSQNADIGGIPLGEGGAPWGRWRLWRFALDREPALLCRAALRCGDFDAHRLRADRALCV
ncbi:MAG: hypothetical protein WDM79_15455 [Terricaulis sp.]